MSFARNRKLPHSLIVAMALSTILVLMLVLVVTIGSAQVPSSLPLQVEHTLSPGALQVGKAAVGELVIHNPSAQVANLDVLAVELPEGLAYVGQAAGSDVTAAAEVDGLVQCWPGPFNLAAGETLVVRYWVVAASTPPGEYLARVALSSGGKILSTVETSVEIGSTAVPAAVGAAQASSSPVLPGQAGDISATKTAEPTELESGNPVAYTVVFSNASDSDLAMDAITDVLPVPFQYVGLAVGSEVVVEPVDTDEPEIVWQGSFTVPANDTLTLRYWVWVPIEAAAGLAPYVNTLTAVYDGTPIGPAESSVTVIGPDVQVTKSVWPLEVLAGEPVTYTVVLENVGNAQGVVDLLSDTLPTGFAFLRMLPGSAIPDPPDGVTGTIVWHGPLTMAIGDVMTLTYQTRSSMASGLEAPANRVVALVEEKLTQSAGAAVQVEPRRIFLPVGERSWEFPYFGVTKTAASAQVYQGGLTTYTVRFTNHGDLPGVLNEILDTLPDDFTFVSMAAGSDVGTPPVGTTGTIVWSGPFVVGPHETLTLVYSVNVGYELGTHVNGATATTLVGRAPREPASASVAVQETVFTIGKTASLPQVYVGETVDYTVNLVNAGGGDGRLDQIRDTLPSGFTFLGMAPGSDVTQPPIGTTGTIVWNGPFDVESGETLTLIYQVQVSDVPGTYANNATATALVGRPPQAPASATVNVTEPVLLWEDFESGTDGWEPFLNYWRLHPEQWYLQAGLGYGGTTGLRHTYFYGVEDPERGAHDALYMYRGAGAEEWTDYRMEARVRIDAGDKMGFWVRGKYEPSPLDGLHVEGYYIYWKPGRDRVELWRLKNSGGTAFHFSDPELLVVESHPLDRGVWYQLAVEVRGSNIKVFVDGNLVINHNDSRWSEGTVGFVTYVVDYGTWDNVLVTPLD
jgi:uncharacterized repeat protein (TIGR01451 family)